MVFFRNPFGAFRLLWRRENRLRQRWRLTFRGHCRWPLRWLLEQLGPIKYEVRINRTIAIEVEASDGCIDFVVINKGELLLEEFFYATFCAQFEQK